MQTHIEELKEQLGKVKAMETAMRINLELISLKMRDLSLAHTRMQIAIQKLEGVACDSTDQRR
jgi:hypothetical protein